MKKALITGITGQDGSYLAEFLLKQGYEVHGMIRRTSHSNTARLRSIYESVKDVDSRFILHYGDVSDSASIIKIIHKVSPDEVYNLAAQSHVKVSFEMPEYTANTAGMGALRVLEAIHNSGKPIKFFQASSSEMYGNNLSKVQNESTPFQPCSPYATAKLFAHNCVNNYRQSYDMFAVSGILFNHESPRRGDNFVSRKITSAVAKILKGEQEKLYLGNIDAKRDWGFAGDYVQAMWLMLQNDSPKDYVVSMGQNYSVKDFLEIAFSYVGLDWNKYVEIDSSFFRPNEVHSLCGDSSKIRDELKWQPNESFESLVHMMMDFDLEKNGINPSKVKNKTSSGLSITQTPAS